MLQLDLVPSSLWPQVQAILLPVLGSTDPQVLVNVESFIKNILIAIPKNAIPIRTIARIKVFIL